MVEKELPVRLEGFRHDKAEMIVVLRAIWPPIPALIVRVNKLVCCVRLGDAENDILVNLPVNDGTRKLLTDSTICTKSLPF